VLREEAWLMNRNFWSKAVLVCGIGLFGSGLVSAWAEESGAPCSAAVYRQFDFWAGDWNVFDFGGTTAVAHARVDPILGGCVLREDYQGADGHKGQSFTIYDSARKVWHQSWVTNRGETLEIEGIFQDGAIVMSGEDHAAGTVVRGTWRSEDGGVREISVTSSDHGKTWKPWFDLMFRHNADAEHTRDAEDKKTVAALDTRYQAAVKVNDAATMDQILADNFALVTGSGKSYTKSDLLAEARSGRVQYDRQDDTDQSVRLWGDTAVITARLTEKGTDTGKAFDYVVWFSDTYVRTPSGWRYVLGQSSLPLNKSRD
jgi:hypothetical protein